MTQEVLAKAAGVSVQTVKRAEKGRPLQPESLMALCSALGVTPRDLGAGQVAGRDHAREAQGGPPEGLGTAVGVPAGDVGASGAHVLPDEWTWAEVAVGGPASTPPRGCAPMPRWETAWVSLLIVVGMALLVVGWTPMVTLPIPFRITQVFGIAVLMGAGLHWSLNVAVRRLSGKGVVILATQVSLVALWLAASGSMTFGLSADIFRHAMTLEAEMDDYKGYRAIMDRMSEADPAYDRREDVFVLTGMFADTMGENVPSLDTLGVFKASLGVKEECLKAWRDAPTYDHSRCDQVNSFHPADKPLELFRAIVGGPFSDGSARARAAEYFTDHRYDKARHAGSEG